MSEPLKLFVPFDGDITEILTIEIRSQREPYRSVRLSHSDRVKVEGAALRDCTRTVRLSGAELPPGRCELVLAGPFGPPQRREFDYEGGDLKLSMTFLPGPGYFVDHQFVPVSPRPRAFLLAVGGKEAPRSAVLLERIGRDWGGGREGGRVEVREFPPVLRGPLSEESFRDQPPPDARLLVVGLPGGRSVDDSGEFIQEVTRQFDREGLRATPAVITHLDGPVVEGMTNELVVRFDPSVRRPLAARIARECGLEVTSPVAYAGNCYVLRSPGGPSYRLLDSGLRLLEDRRVAEVEPHLLHQAQLDGYTPNDPLWSKQDCLQLIGCEDAWNVLAKTQMSLLGGSADVTIAVLDVDGIDVGHPEFSGTVSNGKDKLVAAYDFQAMAPQASSTPGGTHGTQCGGTASAAFDNNEGGAGVAPNCRVIGARLPTAFGAADVADIFLWAAGIDPGRPDFPALPSPAADVLSLSCWASHLGKVPLALRTAIAEVTTKGRGGKGCVVVASTGNLGHVPFATLRPLAARGDVVAVGASTRQKPTSPVDSFHLDPHRNNRGIRVAPETRALYSPYGPEMDLVAPSSTCCKLSNNKDYEDPVLSTVPVGKGTIDGSAGGLGHFHYDQAFGGTSHATPEVAGAAALVLSADPQLSRTQVVDLLRETAQEIDFGNTDPVGQWQDLDGDGVKEFSRWYGHGRVDVAKAVLTAALRARERSP
jgi:hypothetical protein